MSKVHTMSLSLRESKDSIAKTAHNPYVKPRPRHALSRRLHFDFGRPLYLEATRLSATTTPLEFAAFGQGESLLVLVRTWQTTHQNLVITIQIEQTHPCQSASPIHASSSCPS